MLTLRFQRVGKKHDTIFRVIAVDSRFSANSGKAKEILGWWDPRKDKFELKTERIKYWLQTGAQASDSCYNLLVKAKIIEGKKRPVTIHKKKTKEGEDSSSASTFTKASADKKAPADTKVLAGKPEDKETKGLKEETPEPAPAEVPIEPVSAEPIPEAPEAREEKPKEESKPEITQQPETVPPAPEAMEVEPEEKPVEEKPAEEKPKEQIEEIKEDADSK